MSLKKAAQSLDPKLDQIKLCRIVSRNLINFICKELADSRLLSTIFSNFNLLEASNFDFSRILRFSESSFSYEQLGLSKWEKWFKWWKILESFPIDRVKSWMFWITGIRAHWIQSTSMVSAGTKFFMGGRTKLAAFRLVWVLLQATADAKLAIIFAKTYCKLQYV